jgi:hypothetical protein
VLARVYSAAIPIDPFHDIFRSVMVPTGIAARLSLSARAFSSLQILPDALTPPAYSPITDNPAESCGAFGADIL